MEPIYKLRYYEKNKNTCPILKLLNKKNNKGPNTSPWNEYYFTNGKDTKFTIAIKYLLSCNTNLQVVYYKNHRIGPRKARTRPLLFGVDYEWKKKRPRHLEFTYALQLPFVF